MTRSQMVALMRKLIADEQATGFSEGGNLEEPEGMQELLNYLDRAVEEYSKRQAGSKDVRLMKTMTVSDGGRLPDDFLSFCGIVPLTLNGNVMSLYDTSMTMPVRYMARLPYVTSYTDTQELPYEQDQSIAITALGAIYALNKHEYNVSQHLLLMGYGVGSDVSSK